MASFIGRFKWLNILPLILTIVGIAWSVVEWSFLPGIFVFTLTLIIMCYRILGRVDAN